jgi:hypothetical protein
MPPTPDTLLDHPALAGRTVYVRRGVRWEAYLVRLEGGLLPAAGVCSPGTTLEGWRPLSAA